MVFEIQIEPIYRLVWELKDNIEGGRICMAVLIVGSGSEILRCILDDGTD